MNICFFGDLHLPCNTRALQYDVLEWAIEDIRKKAPDCVVFVGDATCNGEKAPFDTFIHAVNKLKLPFLYIPGNSDLLCLETILSDIICIR